MPRRRLDLRLRSRLPRRQPDEEALVEYGRAVVKRWVVRAPVGTVRYWVTLVAVVSRCGATRRMRAKMFLLGLVMPLRDRLRGPREVRLRLRYGRLEVPSTAIGPKSDFDVLNEVLVLKAYGATLPSGTRERFSTLVATWVRRSCFGENGFLMRG